MKNVENLILKMSSIVLFLFILAALVLIGRNPISGYELSVYEAISPLTWAFLITAIIGGIAITVHQAHKADGERGSWWKVGLSLILLSNLIIIMLPFLRGYVFSDYGDHLSHLGTINNIIQTGNLPAGLVYPITHNLISEFFLISNISTIDLMHTTSPIFYLLFVFSTYFLSKEILHQRAAILATVSSTVLFCYYYVEIFPMGFAFITFPIIFLLYFKAVKRDSISLRSLLIILVVLMAFFHPVASFMLTLALVVMELSRFLYNRMSITKSQPDASSPTLMQRISMSLPLISFIVLMLWVWNNFWVWESSVAGTFRWFHGELLQTPMMEQATEAFTTLIARLNLQFPDLLEFSVRLYGHIFIYLVLSLIAIFLLVRNRTSLSLTSRRSIFSYSCLFLVAVLIQLVDYVRPVTILSSGRIIYLVIALFPPLVGLALYQISGIEPKGVEATQNFRPRSGKSKFARGIVVISIITLCSLIGIFRVYNSPLIYLPNSGVTYMEVTGKSWLLNYANPEIQLTGVKAPALHRFRDALLGLQAPYPKWDRYVDPHFNYEQYQGLGESFVTDRYLHLNECDKLCYTELWPEAGTFTWDDFARLERDSSVNKLYTNGETEIWYVRGEAQAK